MPTALTSVFSYAESQGTYRLVNYPAGPHEDVVVAILIAGPDAVASHETALSIHGIADAMPVNIHITVPRRLRKQLQKNPSPLLESFLPAID